MRNINRAAMGLTENVGELGLAKVQSHYSCRYNLLRLIADRYPAKNYRFP